MSQSIEDDPLYNEWLSLQGEAYVGHYATDVLMGRNLEGILDPNTCFRIWKVVKLNQYYVCKWVPMDDMVEVEEGCFFERSMHRVWMAKEKGALTQMKLLVPFKWYG